MPRPRIRRRIRGRPHANTFKPAGIPAQELAIVELQLEEFEAIRLIDHQSLPQQEAATRMGISQPTLSRTLDNARKKLADAIINGKAIRIAKE